MNSDFLSSLLQIVIVLDVVGVVAYFVLTGLKARRTGAMDTRRPSSTPALPDRMTAEPRESAGPDPGRLSSILSRLLPRRAHHTAASAATGDSLEAAFARLQRVLNSYQEGLA